MSINDSSSSSAAPAPAKGKKKVTLSLAELGQMLPSASPSLPGTSGSPATSGSWADDYIELPDAPTGLARPPRAAPSSGGSYGGGNTDSTWGAGYSDRPGRGPPQGHRPGRGPPGPTGHSGRGSGSPFGSTQTGIDSSLPPAPVDPNRLPRNPPYVAFLGNLPHQIMESELGSIMQDLFHVKVADIKIPEDKVTKQRRGFAYVYLSSVDDLMRVLEGSGRTNILGRRVRFDVAEPHQFSDSGRSSSASAFATTSNEPSDWRSSARPPVAATSASGPRSTSIGAGTSAADEGGWRKSTQPVTAVDASAFESARQPKASEPKSTGNASAGPVKVKSNPFGNAKPREQNLEARRDSTDAQ